VKFPLITRENVINIHPLIIVEFFSTLNSELSIFVRQGNAKGEGGVLNAVVEVVLLPDGDPLHVVHVDLDLHPALALLLVHHLLTDVVQGRVIVPGLIMFFIVHKLNFSKIHTIVIWLQKFLECWSEILMVENMTIIVDTKRVSIDTKLVWRNQFLNVLNSHISASYSKKFSNTNLAKWVCKFIWFKTQNLNSSVILLVVNRN